MGVPSMSSGGNSVVSVRPPTVPPEAAGALLAAAVSDAPGADSDFLPQLMRASAETVRRAGTIQSREALLSEVWGYQASLDTRTVDTHVRRLREKLGKAGAVIQTVRGSGYRLGAATA